MVQVEFDPSGFKHSDTLRKKLSSSMSVFIFLFFLVSHLILFFK